MQNHCWVLSLGLSRCQATSCCSLCFTPRRTRRAGRHISWGSPSTSSLYSAMSCFACSSPCEARSCRYMRLGILTILYLDPFRIRHRMHAWQEAKGGFDCWVRTSVKTLWCSIRYWNVDWVLIILLVESSSASIRSYRNFYTAVSSSYLILLRRVHACVVPNCKRLILSSGLVYHSIFLDPCDTDARHFWTAWWWRRRASTTIGWRA